MNASMPASSSAFARVDCRERNSSWEIGGTSRRETCCWRKFQAHVSSFSEEKGDGELIDLNPKIIPMRMKRLIAATMAQASPLHILLLDLDLDLDFCFCSPEVLVVRRSCLSSFLVE